MFGHFGTISEFTGKKGRQTDRQSDREIERLTELLYHYCAMHSFVSLYANAL